MFSSFKNTELFRYFVRVDLNKGIDKILKQNKSNFSLIAGSIFSGSFSILGTYFGMHTNNFNNIWKVVLSCVLFALLFVIGILLFKGAILICSFIYNAYKKGKLPSNGAIKEYIDAFDHIACDNILISQNFIEAYNDINTPSHLKEFYFYEIIYYTKVSLDIIQKLFANKDKCINDKNNTNRVHLFRLENSLKMIKEICSFLELKKISVNVDKLMQPSLYKEISDLKTRFEKFEKECNELKLEKYGINQ